MNTITYTTGDVTLVPPVTKVSEMPAAQMELFAPEPPREQPAIDTLCDLIRDTGGDGEGDRAIGG